MNINFEKILKNFNEEYDYLYANNDNVVGYDEAVKAGDYFIEKNKEFVRKFNDYRGDIISSDREVAAFMFALTSI